MTQNRTWLAGRALWVWAVVVLAFGLAASCYSDPTAPRYVPAPGSVDTTKSQG
jgi:hypothetical protein